MNGEPTAKAISFGLKCKPFRAFFVKYLKKRYHGNQTELARRIGVNKDVINRWLRQDPDLRAELETDLKQND